VCSENFRNSYSASLTRIIFKLRLPTTWAPVRTRRIDLHMSISYPTLNWYTLTFFLYEWFALFLIIFNYTDNLTFIGSCIVIYLYSKTKEMHQFLKFILFCSCTLHVSEGLSLHHPDKGRKDRPKHVECYYKIK